MDLSNNIINRINDMLPVMVPFAIIAASIIGSIHCVGMCGALAMTAGAQSRKGLVYYHLGRLLGYFSVGALAGFLGSEFINSEMKYISLVSTVFLSASFLVIGFSIIKKGQLHIKQPAFLKLFYQNRVGRILESKTSHSVSSFSNRPAKPFITVWMVIRLHFNSSRNKQPSLGRHIAYIVLDRYPSCTFRYFAISKKTDKALQR